MNISRPEDGIDAQKGVEFLRLLGCQALVKLLVFHAHGDTDVAGPGGRILVDCERLVFVLGANGIDPSKEITWLVFPAGELGLALDKGEVDAVADL